MPVPGSDFGRYRVEERIGVGGMGVVYRAVDSQLKRNVALKVVSAQYTTSEEFLRRFAREAEVMARVDSPSIVAIYDYGTLDGLPYLVSQYVGGGDLAQRIHLRGPLRPRQAAYVVAQVAAALAAAHRVDVVHRDVKPANVLLREPVDQDPEELHAYLCDFGIAKPGDGDTITQTGDVTGSWSYMSPERIAGEESTPAGDIYGAGCLLWACLTGSAPYSGTDLAVAQAHRDAPVPQLGGRDEVSRMLDGVLARAMAKDPQQRYADAAELRHDLLSVARVGASPSLLHAQPDSSPTATVRRGHGRGSRLPLAAAAVVGVLLLGGATAAVVGLTGDDAPTYTGPAVAGDINADGKADLVFAGTGGRRATGDSTGSAFTDLHTAPWMAGTTLFTADVTGDRHADLVGVQPYSTKGSTTVTVASDDGRPRTVRLPTRESDSRVGAQAAVGDYDGDGRPDLAVVTRTHSSVDDGVYAQVLLGRGGTRFAPESNWWWDNGWSRDYRISAADVDGDGKADLAVVLDRSGTGRSSEALWALSSGSTFILSRARRLELPTQRGGHSDYVFGDVDGDHRAELVSIDTDRGHSTVKVSAWHRSGWGEPVTWARVQGSLTSPTLLDVDGDRRSDLVATAGRQVRVLLSRRAGFGPARAWAGLPVPAAGGRLALPG